jgi:hypothetical protein
MKKIILIMTIIIALLPTNVLAADINGIIAIVIGNGDIKYGAKINVFLTTKEVSVIPVTENPSQKYDYPIAVIKSLGDAFTKVEEEIKTNPEYIKSKTMTSLAGKFKFSNINPGKYFIVVTFPSKVAMNRVFWQLPVNILNKDIEVELSNDNLSLPPYLDR